MGNKYMYGGRNSEKQRKQRTDYEIELRNTKTDDLIKKMRDNQTRDNNLLSETTTSKAANIQLYTKNISNLNSTNLDKIYNAAYEFRLTLSTQNDPPIQQLIDSGIIPRVVELLNADFYSELDSMAQNIRVECAWILTNIATGSHSQTRVIVKAGAIPLLIQMFNENSVSIFDQAVWCLGNIAGDCEEFRDSILVNDGLVDTLINKIEAYYHDKNNIKAFRNLVWFLSNLNRGRDPHPDASLLSRCVEVFESTIMMDDSEVVSDSFWGISYICDVDVDMINKIINTKILSRILELMHALHNSLNAGENFSSLAKICKYSISPIIRTIGNIVTGSEDQTQVIINSGILEFYSTIFYKYDNKKKPRIRKEICWTISNVAAGSPKQVEYVVNNNSLLTMIIDAIGRYELYIRKEALFTLLQITTKHVCDQPELLEKLLNLSIHLNLKSYLEAAQLQADVQTYILDVIAALLDVGSKLMRKTGENIMVNVMLECGLAELVEDLQESQTNSLARKANSIILEHFNVEEVPDY